MTPRRTMRTALILAALLCTLPGAMGCRNGATSPDTDTDADADADAEADGEADGEADVEADVEADADPGPRRVVAIGDLHGDLGRTVRALRLAGVLGNDLSWTGGETLVVQLGDVLDRGDDERAVIDLFEELKPQAEAAGGQLVNLNGNHEIMNGWGDYRYVTDGACPDFSDLAGLDTTRPEFADLSDACRVRAAAFWPGGPYALTLATWPMVLVLQDSVFVHGGLLQLHLDYGIDAINAETAAWFRGTGDLPWSVVGGEDDAVDWDRTYSDTDEPPDAADCAALFEVLDQLDVSRMIVAHTPRHDIDSDCDGAVWRVDVGMAAYYGGTVQVLQIEDGVLTVLRER